MGGLEKIGVIATVVGTVIAGLTYYQSQTGGDTQRSPQIPSGAFSNPFGQPVGKKTLAADLQMGQCVNIGQQGNTFFVTGCKKTHDGKVVALQVPSETGCPGFSFPHPTNATSTQFVCIDQQQ